MRQSSAYLFLVLTFPACAPALHPSASKHVVVERLFFGRNTAGALMVTDSAWGVFVAEVVTPRFPDGFTQWAAFGQWRGQGGSTEREPTFVVEVVHSAGKEADAAVATIIAEYKRRFRQESVLRVVTPARASF